eukprot:1141234-Amphidinium_carterae.1
MQWSTSARRTNTNKARASSHVLFCSLVMCAKYTSEVETSSRKVNNKSTDGQPPSSNGSCSCLINLNTHCAVL